MDIENIPPEEREPFLAFRERVQGTNISQQSLLATDYLNHFNEIVMLFEMIPMMPEIAEEARQWEPKSYQQHFRDSSFSDKDLAIEAYDHVPTCFRRPFEDVVAALNQLVPQSLDRIEQAAQEDPEKATEIANDASRRMQILMDKASAIIHGSNRALEQSEIDDLLFES